MQVVKLSRASSAPPGSGDDCMLMTGSAVHPGVQVNDTRVHVLHLYVMSLLKLRTRAMLSYPGCAPAGASGGAVMDEGGFLVGLVTSNTKHVGTGHSLARLNFSIHAAALRPLWALLRASPAADRAAAALKRLDVDTPALRQLWALSAQLAPGKDSINAPQRLQQLMKDRRINVAGGQL